MSHFKTLLVNSADEPVINGGAELVPLSDAVVFIQDPESGYTGFADLEEDLVATD